VAAVVAPMVVVAATAKARVALPALDLCDRTTSPIKIRILKAAGSGRASTSCLYCGRLMYIRRST
jgi:hypothetical protein